MLGVFMFTIKKKPVYNDLNGEQTHVQSIRAQDLDGYKLSDIPEYIQSRLDELIPNSEFIRIGEVYVYVVDYDYAGVEVCFSVEIVIKFKQEYIDSYELEYANKLADYDLWYSCNKENIDAEIERIAELQKQIEALKNEQHKIKQGTNP